MGRNDDGFNLDDMMEIFGDSASAASARAVAPSAPAFPVQTLPAVLPPLRVPLPVLPPVLPGAFPLPMPIPMPLPVAAAPVFAAASAASVDTDLTDEEQTLLKQYEESRKKRLLEEQARRVREQLEVREREARRIIEENEREAAKPAVLAVPAPGVADALGDIGAGENEAFCAMLDEIRIVMLSFLVPLIGIKATANMLNKSVEKARAKAPVVLKDANWRMDGSLRDDGSVDPDRLIKNAATLPAETRIADYLAGLRELVDLRLRAVEAGLGASVRVELGARLQAARAGLELKNFPPAWVEAFYSRVLA